jgi:hypothetical protein
MQTVDNQNSVKAQARRGKLKLFEREKKPILTHDQRRAARRAAELNRIYWDKFPDRLLPYNDLGRKWCEYMMRTMAFLTENRRPHWLKKHAPWLSDHERDHLLTVGPRWHSGAWLGQWLELDFETRERLKAWSIKPCDKTDDELRKIRREKDRQRKEADRRANGVSPRGEPLSRTKPWEALGMSRSEWYRRGKPSSDLDAIVPKGIDSLGQPRPLPNLLLLIPAHTGCAHLMRRGPFPRARLLDARRFPKERLGTLGATRSATVS